MIVSIAEEEKRRPNWKELKRAIKRNFSGLMEVERDFNPVKILMENIGFPAEYLQVKKHFPFVLNLLKSCTSNKSSHDSLQRVFFSFIESQKCRVRVFLDNVQCL